MEEKWKMSLQDILDIVGVHWERECKGWRSKLGPWKGYGQPRAGRNKR